MLKGSYRGPVYNSSLGRVMGIGSSKHANGKKLLEELAGPQQSKPAGYAGSAATQPSGAWHTKARSAGAAESKGGAETRARRLAAAQARSKPFYKELVPLLVHHLLQQQTTNNKQQTHPVFPRPRLQPPSRAHALPFPRPCPPQLGESSGS